MKRMLFALAMFVAVAPQQGRAQSMSPQTQTLSACIEQSTTPEDGTLLIRWIFIAMARHPSVNSLASIPDAERVSINRQTGALLNRLILDACPDEARAALLVDGERAMVAPFESFGRRAMEGIMAHPDVEASVAEMASYLDEERLGQLMAQPAN